MKSLIPYSEPNLKLTFRPNQFFNDLEKLDQIKASRQSIRSNYYRSIRKGLILKEKDGIPRLTDKGLKKIGLFNPNKLDKDARILVTFDIPEEHRILRRRLRVILLELKFKQVQKSVYETEYDVLVYLQNEIKENKLGKFINIYESVKIKS